MKLKSILILLLLPALMVVLVACSVDSQPLDTPTPLPIATFTPMPPTGTPIPTPTPTQLPATAIPTSVSTPIPTATPYPTHTPYPTYTPVPTPVHLTETYSSERYGFSIDYASNWEVGDWMEGATGFVEIIHPFGSHVKIVIEYAPGVTLEEFAAVRIAIDENFREYSRVKIESLPGYLSEGIGLDSGSPVDILMVVNGPWAISAGFVTNLGLEELHQPILHAMLESFRMFAPSPT